MTTPVSARPGTSESPAAPPDAWARRGGKEEPPSRWKFVRPPRRIPYLLVGVTLVIAFAAAAVIVSMQLDNRQLVLVLARPVTVGHVLSTQDFRQIAVAADAGLDAVPASDSPGVIGRPAAFSLPAGALLTRASVGVPAIPANGRAVAAVGLKSGQFPPALAPGTRVAVLVSAGSPAPNTNSAQLASPIAQWTATVTDVGAGADQQGTVVSLELGEGDARLLATAPPGQISLVALSGGGS